MLPLLAALLLFPASHGVGTEVVAARSQDSAKKRIEREKRFLLNSADELNRTLASVNGVIELLIGQVEAAARQTEGGTEDRLLLLGWYQKYSDWLKGLSTEFDHEVSNYYAKQQLSSGWTSLFGDLVHGCTKLAGELERMVRKAEDEKKMTEALMQKIGTAITERRLLVDKNELEISRMLWPEYRVPADRVEPVYLDLTDEELLVLRIKSSSLDEQLAYFECLAELGKYEQAWQDLKIEEFARRHELAKAVDGGDPGAAAAALRGTIRTCEADIAILKRSSGELDGKIHTISKSGSLRKLDRLEELSSYYEKMKNRYDSHIEWLKGQIGSYQADLAEINKER